MFVNIVCAANVPCRSRYIRIDGKTPASRRQSLVNLFQENWGRRSRALASRGVGMCSLDPNCCRCEGSSAEHTGCRRWANSDRSLHRCFR